MFERKSDLNKKEGRCQIMPEIKIIFRKTFVILKTEGCS
jgi:hypothetical protein